MSNRKWLTLYLRLSCANWNNAAKKQIMIIRSFLKISLREASFYCFQIVPWCHPGRDLGNHAHKWSLTNAVYFVTSRIFIIRPRKWRTVEKASLKEFRCILAISRGYIVILVVDAALETAQHIVALKIRKSWYLRRLGGGAGRPLSHHNFSFDALRGISKEVVQSCSHILKYFCCYECSKVQIWKSKGIFRAVQWD